MGGRRSSAEIHHPSRAFRCLLHRGGSHERRRAFVLSSVSFEDERRSKLELDPDSKVRTDDGKYEKAVVMRKLKMIFREMKILISEHKLYFLAPLILCLALVALLFVKLGTGLIMTFIYAGV